MPERETISEPVLAVDGLRVGPMDAIDESGETMRAMLLTYSGRTVVDRQELPSTEVRVAIPADIFVATLIHMHQVAASNGLTHPLPFTQCPAQLLATDTGGDPVAVYRCERDQHPAGGRHLSRDPWGVTIWTDEQAAAVWDEFDAA